MSEQQEDNTDRFVPIVESLDKLQTQINENNSDSQNFKNQLLEIANSMKGTLEPISKKLQDVANISQQISTLTNQLAELKQKNAELEEKNKTSQDNVDRVIQQGIEKEKKLMNRIQELTEKLNTQITEINKLMPSKLFSQELETLKQIDSEMKKISNPQPGPGPVMNQAEPQGQDGGPSDIQGGKSRKRKRKGKKTHKKYRGGWTMKKSSRSSSSLGKSSKNIILF